MESDSQTRDRAALNPATRLVAAVAAAVVAISSPPWISALILTAAILVGARVRRLRALGLVMLGLLPVIGSSILINLVLPAGNRPLAGLESGLRLAALTLPLSLLFATTPVTALLAELEVRGLPPGAAFVVAAALAAVPSTQSRLARLRQGRSARGLDRERGLLARSRAVLELTGSAVSRLLSDVEDRTLALEVRGFRSARRRTQLEATVEGRREPLLRWALIGLALALAAAGWRGWR